MGLVWNQGIAVCLLHLGDKDSWIGKDQIVHDLDELVGSSIGCWAYLVIREGGGVGWG